MTQGNMNNSDGGIDYKRKYLELNKKIINENKIRSAHRTSQKGACGPAYGQNNLPNQLGGCGPTANPNPNSTQPLNMNPFQFGGHHRNPTMVNDISNIQFVVGNQILDSDINAVVLSLVEEFSRIGSQDLRHNLELSQFYSPSQPCEHKELVLRYTDSVVCISNERIVNITKAQDDTYSVDQAKNKAEINCDVSRGIIRFYLKEKIESNEEEETCTFLYRKLCLVKIIAPTSLSQFTDRLYLNNKEMNKLLDANTQALTQGQTEAFKSQRGGCMANTNPQNLTNSTSNVNSIIKSAGGSAMASQMRLMTHNRILSVIPDRRNVNAASIVASNMMSTQAASDHNLVAIMVPGSDTISIAPDQSVPTISARIGGGGTIQLGELAGKTTSLTSNVPITTASIPVDATVAAIPASSVANTKGIAISSAKDPSLDTKNTLKKWYDAFVAKSKEYADQLGKAIEQPVKTETVKTSSSTVVPVTKEMGIMTKLPEAKASINVPTPSISTPAINPSVVSNMNSKLSIPGAFAPSEGSVVAGGFSSKIKGFSQNPPPAPAPNSGNSLMNSLGSLTGLLPANMQQQANQALQAVQTYNNSKSTPTPSLSAANPAMPSIPGAPDAPIDPSNPAAPKKPGFNISDAAALIPVAATLFAQHQAKQGSQLPPLSANGTPNPSVNPAAKPVSNANANANANAVQSRLNPGEPNIGQNPDVKSDMDSDINLSEYAGSYATPNPRNKIRFTNNSIYN